MIELDGQKINPSLGPMQFWLFLWRFAEPELLLKKFLCINISRKLSDNKDDLKIPLPMFNILNGGRHAKNGLDIQEFMIVPHKKTIVENLVVCNAVFNNLKETSKKILEKIIYNWGMKGDLLRRFHQPNKLYF